MLSPTAICQNRQSSERQEASFQILCNRTTPGGDPEGITEYHVHVAIVGHTEGDGIAWDPVGKVETGIAGESDILFVSTVDVTS